MIFNCSTIEPGQPCVMMIGKDRKSTRLNSSHGYISYAVFCLKKKKNKAGKIDGHIVLAIAGYFLMLSLIYRVTMNRLVERTKMLSRMYQLSVTRVLAALAMI